MPGQKKKRAKKAAAKRFRQQGSKLTEQVVADIVLAVRNGNYLETAAAFAGVNKWTFQDWLRRGRTELRRLAEDEKARPLQREAPYADLVARIEEAMAASEIGQLNAIKAAGTVDWKAIAWVMEKRFQRRWGPRVTVGFEEEPPPLVVEIVGTEDE